MLSGTGATGSGSTNTCDSPPLAQVRVWPTRDSNPDLVQSAIGDQLARQLLAGEIRDGDTVRVDLDAAADRLTVTRG